MRFVKTVLQCFLEEIRELKTPLLPVGIYLVTTLCLVVWKDKQVSSPMKSMLQPASDLLRLSPDCLYGFVALFVVPLLFLLLVRENPARYGLSLGKMKVALPILAVFLLGFYAYVVDSFIYCVIVHAWFALVIDLSIGLG